MPEIENTRALFAVIFNKLHKEEIEAWEVTTDNVGIFLDC